MAAFAKLATQQALGRRLNKKLSLSCQSARPLQALAFRGADQLPSAAVVSFRAGVQQRSSALDGSGSIRWASPAQPALGTAFAPTMQGHDAYAERARDLALQLSLSRQIICFRELGDNFRLRVLSLFAHRRFLGRFFHFGVCFDASYMHQ
jgi:hypothetical protein